MKTGMHAQTHVFYMNSSLRDKVMAGFIVFCMLLNGLSPRLVFDIKDHGLISKAIAGQPVVKQVLSLSVISLKIARYLLHVFPAKQGSPDGSQKNNANASSEYSLVNFTKKDNSSSSTGVSAVMRMRGLFNTLVTQCFDSGLPRAPSPVPMYLLLLMLLYSFARSTTGDAVRSIRYFSVNPTRRDEPGFLFSDISPEFDISFPSLGGLS